MENKKKNSSISTWGALFVQIRPLAPQQQSLNQKLILLVHAYQLEKAMQEIELAEHVEEVVLPVSLIQQSRARRPQFHLVGSFWG